MSNTITHNWKTYRFIDDKWWEYDLENHEIKVKRDSMGNDLVWFEEDLPEYGSTICNFHTVERLIKLWYLELVEDKPEKKESWRSSIERIAKQEAIKLSNEIDKPVVQLIRDELERRKQIYIKDNYGESCIEEVDKTLSFIDSLTGEKEAQPEEKYPRATAEDILKYSTNQNANTPPTPEQWAPVKGEEIEVSDDGEKWDRWYFVERSQRRYWVEDNGFSWGYYARPVEKIDTVPVLPSYTYDVSHSFDSIWEQVEALTDVAHYLLKKAK